MPGVNIKTIGCKVNQYESEAIAELFQNAGYSIVSEGPADVYVINTCTVTQLSSSKSRQFISKAKKENPSAVIAVIGCYAQISPEEVRELGGIDIVLGTSNRNELVALCSEVLIQRGERVLVTDFNSKTEFEEMRISRSGDRTRGYIKIQEGCNRYCSYCIIPYARGPIRSRDHESAVEEAQRLANSGYIEVVLTGIHVASYGIDQGRGNALIELIEDISKIEGIQRIRLGSLEPSIINEEFLCRLHATEKFCDHFHLSLQSGSDTVLKRMNRKYDSESYYEKVQLIRSIYPNAGITTDIIVGFPRETADEFLQTVEFVKRVGFSRVHIFRFSPRAGTPAASYEDQVSSEVKKMRAAELEQETLKVVQLFENNLMGEEMDILIEEACGEKLSGYTTNYLKAVLIGDESMVGKIVRAVAKGVTDTGELEVEVRR